jgi:hypothetical protein
MSTIKLIDLLRENSESEFKIGTKVNIPFLSRRENGYIRRIEDDEAMVLVQLQNIKGKPPVNKDVWVKLKDLVKI